MSRSHADVRHEVNDARFFGRVAVMYGGDSSEREVSLVSGKAVLEALRERGVDAHGWDPAGRSLTDFADSGFDRVWIALHGPGGEDGALQGALQWIGVPYTGSGVMASAIAMDKVRSKRLFIEGGIATPEYVLVSSEDDAELAIEALGLPIIVKPSGQGSSVGMTKVTSTAELPGAISLALEYGQPAIAEKCVIGEESTVAVLQGSALPSIRIETPRVFYDYRAKYESDKTEYHCPGCDDVSAENRIKELALAAFAALGCSGWGRVDFMTGSDGAPQVLEVNTVPGMTSHSLVPMSAQTQGIDFQELCWRVLETSVAPQQSIGTTVGVAANDA